MNEFLLFGSVFALGALSPGPDLLMILRNSIVYSRKAALFTILGVGLGILIHLSYILLGIGLVISQSILLFNLIKYLGAAYLIYIGYKSLKSRKEDDNSELPFELKGSRISNFNAAKIGFLTNVLNPKVSLFLLAFFTQAINPNTSTLLKIAYSAEMLIVSLACFAFVALLVTQDPIKKIFTRTRHYIERAFGAILIALGIKVALSSR